MDKKIFIAGGSGLIGKRLTQKLNELNYQTIILSRKDSKISVKYPNSPKELAKLIDGADAIINLAGANIVGKRWNKEYKKELYDSRINTTRLLVEAINLTHNKPYFISTSAVGYYGDRGNKVLNEDTNPDNGFIASICTDWEDEAKKADTKTFITRIGIVLANEGGALKEMLLPYKLFIGGPLSNGKQWFPWIHIDDLLYVYVNAIENKLTGTANIVSPHQVQMNEFAQTLGSVLHRPAIFRVPAFAVKLILGEASQEVLRSQRVNPKYLLDINFNFKFNTLSSALKDLLEK